MIMEWLRKKTIHEIWRKNGAEKRQVGEQEDEIRLLNHIILQNDSMMQDFLNQRDQAQRSERAAEKTVKALMADLETDRETIKKWERWSSGAIEKIMVYESKAKEEMDEQVSLLPK